MKIAISFVKNRPKFSILGVEGNLLYLSTRTAYIVSKDPYADPKSFRYSFYFGRSLLGKWTLRVEPGGTLRPGSVYIPVLDAITNKANAALAQSCPVDLSDVFNDLDRVDPFRFEGLFDEMKFRSHRPVISARSQKKLGEMREWLKANIDQVEGDAHLLDWLGLVHKPVIWKDITEDYKGS